MYHVKITRFGDAIALTVPAEALAKFGLKEGDDLVLRDTPEGLRLDRSTGADHRKALERTLNKYDAAFRELAK